MHKSERSRWGRSVWPTRWVFSLHLLLQCRQRFYSAVHKSHEGGRFAKDYELLSYIIDGLPPVAWGYRLKCYSSMERHPDRRHPRVALSVISGLNRCMNGLIA